MNTEQLDWSDWFYYDETSPSCLRWKVNRTNTKHHRNYIVREGDVAGFLGSDNYWYNFVKKVRRPTHLVVWEMLKGKIPRNFIIDHKDGNTLNNSITNLRIIESCKNSRNCKMNKRNSTGVTGVSFRSNKSSTLYAVAAWCDMKTGVKLAKSFSVKKLGIMVAFRDAVQYREKMIAELNAQGAGYTQRHGK